MKIITAPLDEGGTTDRGEGSLTTNRSNTDWSKFERDGVAPVFRFVLGGEDTPITSRFGEGWRLLPSSSLEYESRTGAVVVAGEALMGKVLGYSLSHFIILLFDEKKVRILVPNLAGFRLGLFWVM